MNLAAALLHGPQILLLDEPTVGVDPQSRNQIFSSLEELKRQGKTLVYTTHYMEEAERLCDRIIIIDHGKVIANDTLEAVRRLVPSVNVLEIGVENPGRDGWLDGLRMVDGVSGVEWDGARCGSRCGICWRIRRAVLVWLRGQGYRVQPLDQPARGPGDGVPDIDRKESTQRMSYTAFQALVRRDLRLFFQDRRAVTMSFVAPIVIASFFGYIFGGAAQDRASLRRSWWRRSIRMAVKFPATSGCGARGG